MVSSADLIICGSLTNKTKAFWIDQLVAERIFKFGLQPACLSQFTGQANNL